MKLYDYYKSKLIEKGLNEFISETGELILFDNEVQFTTKILKFDDDIKKITNELFNQLMLEDDFKDNHFKRNFLMKFIHRKIGTQTIEMFQMELMTTFLTYEHYINSLYNDLEKYILNENISNSQSAGDSSDESISNNITKNRQAFTTLPQNNINIDLNNDVLRSADDNTISNNSTDSTTTNTSKNNSESMNNSKSYNLDQLVKSNHLFNNILDEFDKRCFYQLF